MKNLPRFFPRRVETLNHGIEPLEARIAPANLAFAMVGGGAKVQAIQSIGVDAEGNSYVAGRFQGTVDFDPGPGIETRTAPAGNTDGFVAKYTGAGTLAWVDVVRTLRTSGPSANTIELAVAANGDVFIYSSFGTDESVSFSDRLGPAAFTVTMPDPEQDSIFVAKIDTTGAFRWATSYGSIGPDLDLDIDGASIALDDAGGIYLTGLMDADSSAGTITFGTTTLTTDIDETNIFVVKLLDGALGPTVQWANSASSAGLANFRSSSIAVNPTTGVVVVGGAFNGTQTFQTGAGPVSITAPDIFDTFVAQLDAAGVWTSAGVITTGGDEDAAEVAADRAGNVYVVGSFVNTADLDPGPGVSPAVSKGESDAFVVKLDAAGALVRAQVFGTTSFEEARSVFVTRDNHLHVAITFGETLDFDLSAGTFALESEDGGSLGVLDQDENGVFISAIAFGTSYSTTEPGVLINSEDPHNLDAGFAFAADATHGLYLGGTLVRSVALMNGPGSEVLKSKGGSDFFVARYFLGNLVGQDLQQPVLAQSFALGSAGEQSGFRILKDATGDTFVAGAFSGTVDFDPGAGVSTLTSSDPDGNIFVVKYDPTGAFSWVQQVKMSLTFDHAAHDPAVHLALDDAGNVYLATEFDASATVGTLPAVINSQPSPIGGDRDILIAKLSPTGVALWAEAIGSAGQNDLIDGFAVHGPTGTVALSSQFVGTVDFDPSAAVQNRTSQSSTGSDGFILALETTGAFRWVRQLSAGASNVFPEGVAFLVAGDVVATGAFSGTVDFNFLTGGPSTLTSAPGPFAGDDAFVARFDAAAGTVVWKQASGGALQENGNAIAVNSADQIFVAGQFRGAVDFDAGAGVSLLIENGGGPGGTSEDDVYLQKLDANGTLLGAVGFGGTGGEDVFGLKIIGTDSVFLLGKFGMTADLDPGAGVASLTTKSENTLFVSRFDPGTLKFISAFKLEGTGFDTARVHDSEGIIGGSFTVDAGHNVYLTGGFTGTFDADPAGSLVPLSSKGAHDIAVLKFSPPTVFDAAHPRTFHDADGDLITLSLSGPGTATFSLAGNASDLADLVNLQLAGTTLLSSFSMSVKPFGSGSGASFVQKIVTTQPLQHVGSIDLDGSVTLGDGTLDTVADLHVSGALKSLTLGDLAANTIVQLGDDLPYNFASDKTTPDTYNNHPVLTIGHILGAGVSIDVLNSTPSPGPGLPAPTGGGGLGNVIIGSWNFPGLIRTTQSVGNFTVLNDDASPGTPGVFLAVIEVDRFHVGEATTANVGVMTFVNGSWGSTGTVIEGNVTAFNAEAFLAGATIEAGSLGKVTTGPGNFAGTITLTNSAAVGTSSFTVASNFTGTLISKSPLKKLNVRGNFTGSLFAPSIAGITAFSFDGTQTAGVNDTAITATTGALGQLKTLSGVFKNYDLVTSGKFAGMDVKLSKLISSRVGIENVHITAASIGNLNVALTASPTATDVNFAGIRNSTFVATGAVGIAATIGKITVTLGGQDGAAIGLDNVDFTGKSIGATSVTVGHRLNLGTDVRALDTAVYRASAALGPITLAGDATGFQATTLTAVSAGTIGAIVIKSKNSDFGSLVNSTILAGQGLVFTAGETAGEMAKNLKSATLGAVTLSGSLTGTLIAAGSNIGAVTVGNLITSSNILAGATLGSDLALDGVNDAFQHAASIAAITTKIGGFVLSSAAAGIDPVAGGFGDGDDKIAVAGPANVSGRIGPIKFAAGAMAPYSPSGAAVSHVIEAAILKSLTVPVGGPFSFTLAGALLDNLPAAQDSGDTLVRLR